MWLILKRGYPCLISISEKSSVEIFLRNGFLNSAHFSTIGPTLKPFGLERVNKTPLALGLHVLLKRIVKYSVWSWAAFQISSMFCSIPMCINYIGSIRLMKLIIPTSNVFSFYYEIKWIRYHEVKAINCVNYIIPCVPPQICIQIMDLMYLWIYRYICTYTII